VNREREEASQDQELRLLVVIPCLNEEMTVSRVIAAVPRKIAGVEAIEVLVIDDSSSDGTVQRAREAGVEVLRHPVNLGLGRTFQHGVSVALEKAADIMVHIDGDGQFDGADIPLLVEPIIGRRADMVTASRFLDPSLVPAMPALKKWGNRVVARVVQLLTGKRYHDVSCGFRSFSVEALLRLNLFGEFTYTHECFLELAFKNLEILEVPVKVSATREFGESRMASSLIRYAFSSLEIMVRAFISYRPLRFFSFLAAIFFGVGFGFLAFLALHYASSGAFSPHIWAGFVGGSSAFVGVSTLITGLMGDMLMRVRSNQESILFRIKQAEWTRLRENNRAAKTSKFR